MKRYLILAAIAAFPTVAAAACVPARTLNLTADELELCRILELAHETTCVEYELVVARQAAAAAEATQKN